MQKILFAVVGVILLFVLAVLYKQQLAIKKLQSSNAASAGSTETKSPGLAEVLKSNVLNGRKINGTVKKTTADYLVVDAEIIDASKIQEGVDYAKNPLPKIQRTFKVLLTPDTKFVKKDKVSIAVGDKVVVDTDASPNLNEELKAISITIAN